MKMRFREDKDYRKFKHRYLSDLTKQMREVIEPMDKKIAADKEALILKVEAAKDKLEASGKLGTDIANSSDPVDANAQPGRARMRDAQDEVCEICGTYTSFTGAVIMRHDAGLLHVGWGRLRESFAKLQKELKASKEGLTADELIGAAEPERSRSKSRDQRRKHRDGRKDVEETRNRDRDRRREYDQKSREYDQKSRGRERDTHSDRGRDRYDDRRADTSNRDRDHRDRDYSRRHGDDSGRSRQGRSRKAEEVDEFGRAKAINKEYREGVHPIREEDKRGGGGNRSRSRDAGKSKGGGSLIEDTPDCKTLQIEFSEDWQEVMNQKCVEYELSMSDWDMTCRDSKGKDPADGGLHIDSFPLRFKFTRKA